jgi:uncharacterized protein (DUF4213/DUF364 family)
MNPVMLKQILDTAEKKSVITEVKIYLNWVIVKSNKYAMSTLLSGMPGLIEPQGMNTYMGNILGKNAIEMAEEFLVSKESLKRAVGMACLKSILPLPLEFEEGNAIDRHHDFAREHATCFVGHFSEAQQWRSEGSPVDIVELFPRPGDIHWDNSHEVLGKAELVLMTGLALVNDTFEEVIRRTPCAKFRVIMGPTVPLCPVLFDFGVDQIGGTLIDDAALTIEYCSLGGGSIVHAPAGALRKVNLTPGPSPWESRGGAGIEG